MFLEEKSLLPGPYAPTLILHGGAGNITRKNLPPALYDQYESSLLKYLDSARQLLNSGSSALDAAVHAVSLMEDDPLYNCGRGSVFTEKGTIEMEASIMVASVDPDRQGKDDASIAAEQKRGASVSLIKETRHPIQLAREVLLVRPTGKASSMHCQLSGLDVEEWGWKERGLERKDHEWFWTKRRWGEHLRDLQQNHLRDASRVDSALVHNESTVSPEGNQDTFLPSQGTVGAVCMDSWGDVAVATSTGGLTNKKAGRIGDTPTLGAGFWAESWEERVVYADNRSKEQTFMVNPRAEMLSLGNRLVRTIDAGFGDLLHGCLPHMANAADHDLLLYSKNLGARATNCVSVEKPIETQPRPHSRSEMVYERGATPAKHKLITRRRAVALSGTGNGDTFLRTAACSTTAAICRFSTHSPTSNPTSLAKAVNMTAGPEGELQRSAGDRWKVTGEGQAGMIGIEVGSSACDAEEDSAGCVPSKQPRRIGSVVFGFNCGGLWRAWIDDETGNGKVMVFKEEYR
jgi:L-asparaginase